MSYNFAISSNQFPSLYTWGTETNMLMTGNEDEPVPVSVSLKIQSLKRKKVLD